MDYNLELTMDGKFEIIMRDYLQKVHRLVYLFVKNQSLAEDITQEVFVKAYKNLNKFRGDCSLQTWIYKIAVNESKKYLRSWSVKNLYLKSDIDQIMTSDTESEVIDLITKKELVKAIMNLKPQYRQLIILHYYENLSVQEIAKILSLSPGAIHTKLHRARKHLKEEIKRSEGDV